MSSPAASAPATQATSTAPPVQQTAGAQQVAAIKAGLQANAGVSGDYQSPDGHRKNNLSVNRKADGTYQLMAPKGDDTQAGYAVVEGLTTEQLKRVVFFGLETNPSTFREILLAHDNDAQGFLRTLSPDDTATPRVPAPGAATHPAAANEVPHIDMPPTAKFEARVGFAYNSSAVTGDYLQEVRAQADVIAGKIDGIMHSEHGEHPEKFGRYTVVATSSADGDANRNIVLAQERAEAVKTVMAERITEQLKAKGWTQQQIDAAKIGDSLIAEGRGAQGPQGEPPKGADAEATNAKYRRAEVYEVDKDYKATPVTVPASVPTARAGSTARGSLRQAAPTAEETHAAQTAQIPAQQMADLNHQAAAMADQIKSAGKSPSLGMA